MFFLIYFVIHPFLNGLCLNKRLSKQLRPQWFETPSYSLWRHCNSECSCVYYHASAVAARISFVPDVWCRFYSHKSPTYYTSLMADSVLGPPGWINCVVNYHIKKLGVLQISSLESHFYFMYPLKQPLRHANCFQKVQNCQTHIEGILPKGPHQPCLRMAGRALLAGYHRYDTWIWTSLCPQIYHHSLEPGHHQPQCWSKY